MFRRGLQAAFVFMLSFLYMKVWLFIINYLTHSQLIFDTKTGIAMFIIAYILPFIGTKFIEKLNFSFLIEFYIFSFLWFIYFISITFKEVWLR